MITEHRRAQNREAMRRWREKNRKKERMRERAAYAQNPEPRRAACRKWRAKYPERQAAADRAWRLGNLDIARANGRRWAERNREAVRARNRARKIARRAKITRVLMQAQRGRCAYCRSKLEPGRFHIDHILPRKLGGSNEHSNLQLTCCECNFEKAAMHPIEYAKSLGRLL